jgi:hypothetical protein
MILRNNMKSLVVISVIYLIVELYINQIIIN